MDACTAAGAGPPGIERPSTHALRLMASQTSCSKAGWNAFEFGKGKIRQRGVRLDAIRHKLADHPMRIAEGNALFDEIIRTVGGVGKAACRARRHDVLAEGHRAKHRGENRQALEKRIACIEERLFVLLHILVIGKRNALHHRQQGKQIAVDTSGFAAQQLGDVRFFFLRHDG